MKSWGRILVALLLLGAVALVLAAGLAPRSSGTRERCSSGSLKTVASAQADFSGNDRDENGVQDFWRVDIAGLYSVVPTGSTEMIKLIELSVAAADPSPTGALPMGEKGPGQVPVKDFARPGPRAGYFYKALRHADEKPGALDPKRFAACAYPAEYRDRAFTFIISEENTIYRRDLGRPGPPDVYPDPATRARDWAKLD